MVYIYTFFIQHDNDAQIIPFHLFLNHMLSFVYFEQATETAVSVMVNLSYLNGVEQV